MRKGKVSRSSLSSSISEASSSKSTALNSTSLHDSMFVFEQKETLPGLPFLIWEFPGGGIQEVMVVRDGFLSVVQ